MDATATLTGCRVVPVVVLEDASIAVTLAETLAEAGIAAIEVTLRTAAGLAAINAIHEAGTDILVGAGSVRTAEQMRAVRDAGARFAVSPGFAPGLIRAAQDAGLPFVPGAVTASEALQLLEHGYTLQKFFPAELAGGLPVIKALSEPLPEVRFFATGGINAERAAAYFASGKVAHVGGSWLTPADALRAGDFDRIGELAMAAAAL